MVSTGGAQPLVAGVLLESPTGLKDANHQYEGTPCSSSGGRVPVGLKGPSPVTVVVPVQAGVVVRQDGAAVPVG